MPVESVEELAHIAACDILGYAVALTDLLGDACFVIFALQELKNLGTYQVQAKHLAVVNVEQNRAVLGLRAAYVVRDSEHGLMGELAIPVPLRLWLQTETQSTHINFCSETNGIASKRLLLPWDRARGRGWGVGAVFAFQTYSAFLFDFRRRERTAEPGPGTAAVLCHVF